MKKIYYILFALFILCPLLINAKEDNNRLPEKIVLKNNVKVLANRAFVRFKQGYTSKNSIKALSSAGDFKIERRMKKPENTLFFKKNINYLSKKEAEIAKAEEYLTRTFVVSWEGDKLPGSFCKDLLKSNPAVEIAEPYRVYKFQQQSFNPNDNLVMNQYSTLASVNMFKAWALEKGDTNVVIAISDSDINREHKDLEESVKVNYGEIPGDGIDNDDNGYIDDHKGYNFLWDYNNVDRDVTYTNNSNHGTGVAGIAAASTNNNRGIAGIGFNCKFIPIKIGQGTSVDFGYESVLYAADRGADVLNLSWGLNNVYSEIEKSFIDYALAKDVAIVASAGNVDGSIGADTYSTYYPANYHGVLGVGNVMQNGFIDNGGVIGASANIFAPGEGIYSTKDDGDYGRSGYNGTSFASPVVAGIVGLVRSRFPELSAIQAIQHVRLCGDYIVDKNTNNPLLADSLLFPRMVDAYEAVKTEPFSRPSIVAREYEYLDAESQPEFRFGEGDEIGLRVKAHNYLGAADELTFKLSVAKDPAKSVEITQPEVVVQDIGAEKDLVLEGFKIKINKDYIHKVFLRIDITDGNGYHDFMKFVFYPTVKYNTFSNDYLEFSVSDFGNFGFFVGFQDTYGDGFKYKDLGNQLYESSGLIASEGTSKAAIFLNEDFRSNKPFYGEDENTGILDVKDFGLRITQEIRFPKQNSKALQMTLKVKNRSNDVMQDPAVGILLDWDINYYADNDSTYLFDEAIPEDFPENSSSAMMVDDEEPNYPVFGAIAYSKEQGSLSQAAGLGYDTSISYEEVHSYLNSRESLQLEERTDINFVIGMKFPGQFNPQEERECLICIGAGDTKDELAAELEECIKHNTSVADRDDKPSLRVYPQPSDGLINISGKLVNNSSVKIRIFDIFGNEVAGNVSFAGSKGSLEVPLDLSMLATGKYFLKVENGTYIETVPFMIVK